MSDLEIICETIVLVTMAIGATIIGVTWFRNRPHDNDEPPNVN